MRHAEAEHNAAGQRTGPAHLPLTERGRAQALAQGHAHSQRLRGLHRVVLSPFLRARETAELMWAGAHQGRAGTPPLLDPCTTPGLSERSLGPHPSAVSAHARLAWDVSPSGGESNRDVALRVLETLIAAGPGPALLVSHAGPLRVLLGLLDGVPVEQLGTLKIPLCAPVWRPLPRAELQRLFQRCSRARSLESP